MIDALPLLLGPEGYQISRSVRLRSSASATFTRTPGSATNRTTWTWSAWVKRGALGNGVLLNVGGTTNNTDYQLLWFASDSIDFHQQTTTGYTARLLTTAVFRDPSAWYHVVAVWNSASATSTLTGTASDRMQLWINGTQVTAFSTTVVPALNLNSRVNLNAAHGIGGAVSGSVLPFDGYLTEVNFIDGQALTPSSFGEFDTITGVWKPKRYTGTYGTNGFYLNFSDNSSRMALGYSQAGGTHVDIVESDGSNQTISAGVGACRVSTISTSNSSLPSASNEYLVVTPAIALPITSSLKIYFDINYAWANGRNLYINGTQVASGNVTVATVSGMQEWTINYTGHGITSLSSITTPQNSGGRAVFYGISIDGTTVVASANDWTPNNISVTAGVTYDSMLDVPTQWADGGNGRGNYATLSPLAKSSNITVSDGNLYATSSAASYNAVLGTIAPTSGKWYFEMTLNASVAAPDVGWHQSEYTSAQLTAFSSTTRDGGYCIATDGTGTANTFVFNNGTRTTVANTGWATNDVIGCAIDIDNKKIWFSRNGTWYPASVGGSAGDPANGTNPAITYTYTGLLLPRTAAYSGGYSSIVNFGQRPFAYTPPSGFKALNTLNLPTPTILKGNQFFDATTYTGNGSTLAVTNSGSMQPDLVWVKQRGGTTSHVLQDAIRGAGKSLFSNATSAESGNAGDLIASFNSNGFTVNDTYLGGSGGGGTNGSSGSYVGWQWKEGAAAGFDIVTATMNASGSTTINHSLGVVPNFVITKNRSGTIGWNIYSSVLGVNQYLGLNTTAAATTSAGFWGAPSSTQFTFSSAFANTGTYVAYLFAEVAGFSKFGSYTGNGSANGPMIFTGFLPRWILIKEIGTSSYSWNIIDTARDSYNTQGLYLFANTSAAEGSGSNIDILSNGFKLRNAGAGVNGSGNTYIYACFASNPFKNSLAR